MLKKLIVLVLLIALCGSVDAQRRYIRKKKKVETTTDDGQEVEKEDVYDIEEYDGEDDDMLLEIDEEEDEEGTRTEIQINTKAMGKYLNRSKKKKTIKFEPLVLLGWNGVDLDSYEGNVFSGAQDFSDMNFKAATSWYVGLFPLGISVNLYEQRLHLVTGMGFQFYNYKFSDSVVFSTQKPYNVEYYQPDMLKKTKLGSSYLSTPLLLQFNSAPSNKGMSDFSVAGGVILGYRLKTWTKMKLDNGSKVNGPDGNYNFNNFVYSAAFMIGFRDVKLFGTYQLTPMHRGLDGYNVNAYPFSFGLMF